MNRIAKLASGLALAMLALPALAKVSEQEAARLGRDLTPVGAERKGYFEDAVLDAVSQWRYEPRIYAGAPIDQRVKLRINFERKLD